MGDSERIRSLLQKVMRGKDLSFEDSVECAEIIVEGGCEAEIVSALLTALRMKGESSSEIAGFARVMLEKAVKPRISQDAVDTCGTGGDGSHTFNVSTACAVVLSCAGIPVAKHGNRAVSSSVGSADILEKIGVKIEVAPDEVEYELQTKGFVFLFAPLFHPAMKNVAPVRRKLGIRTIFNLLGPLTNPVEPSFQMIGVSSYEFAVRMGEAISVLRRPKNGVLVVGSSEDGEIDEVSICGETRVIEISEGKVRSEWKIFPEDFGVKRRKLETLRYLKEPVLEFLEVLEGNCREELIDFVCANAGVALMFLGKVRSLKEGFELSRELLLSGAVFSHLKRIKEHSVRNT